MENKKQSFTSGPWEVDSGMVQTAANHIPIAFMDRTPANGTLPCERDSNAHLIAAAPELLIDVKHALGDVLARLHMMHAKDTGIERAILNAQVVRYRATIAKAEGKL